MVFSGDKPKTSTDVWPSSSVVLGMFDLNSSLYSIVVSTSQQAVCFDLTAESDAYLASVRLPFAFDSYLIIEYT